MEYIAPILLIVGGILALSNLIVAKKPDAKAMLDKLTPYQAGIGIALLASGIYVLLRTISFVFTLLSAIPLMGLAIIGVFACSILLGFMFGMPQIAKWVPGEGAAEQKGMELSKKLAPFQVIIGMIGIAASLVWLAYTLHILGRNF